MKVTTEKSKATVTRVVKIIADRPVVHPGGYKRKFRVDTIAVTYTWDDGRFAVSSNFDVSMSGHWTKQDGSDAKGRAYRMWPEYDYDRMVGWESQYDFLKPIIELLRPAGDLSMTILNEAEVGA